MLRSLLLSVAFGAVAAAAPQPTFDPYPGARLLCSQHITGNSMHIIWQTVATRDDIAKVVAFYEKSTKQKAGSGERGARTFDGVDKANDKMSIYPAAKNDDFPKCEVKPTADEKTVLLISKAIR